MEDLIFDSDFIKKLNALKLSIKAKSNTNLIGGRKSNAKGSSVEFSDYREYNLGDDLRRVDWNAYGRFDKIYIKLFSEEREGVFNIFLDTSESMNFGEKSKRVMALQIVGGLVYTILNTLDRVGVHTVNNGELHVSTGKTGRHNFYNMLKELSDIKFEGYTGLCRAIKDYPFKYKGVAVIISDFYEADELEDVLKYLVYKKQEVILIRILSQEEINPELTGALNLIDCENSNNSYKVDVNASLLNDYNKAYNDFNKKLSELSMKYQAKLVLASTEDSYEEILLELGK